MDGLTRYAALGLLAGLSACAGSGDRYPSLALRPFETGEAPPSPPPAPIVVATAPAIGAGEIAALRGRAAAAHAAFQRQQPVAARLARAAAGQSVESNTRAQALVALAELTSLRSNTAGVLADLDLHAVNAATALRPDPALEMAQSEAAALVASEDAALVRLWEVMGS